MKLSSGRRRLAGAAMSLSRAADVENASRLLSTAVLFIAWLSADISGATIIRFQTSLGNVDVRLYDTATPLSVANFLSYSNANRYDGTFIHRSPPDFVVQGGGYSFVPPNLVDPVVDPANPDPPVMNEPGISNLRGTIAMAKLGNNPNSATSQWFFNLKDNSGPPPALDTQNGGFTVFGRVVGNGMSVVDAIDQLPEFNLGSGFEQVPLRGTSNDALGDRLVFINSVTVRNLPAGDYNFDGMVTMADYNIWRSSLGSTTNVAADGNGDGIVNAADYTIWRDTFQSGGGSGSFAAGGAVPEPASALLAILAAALLACRRLRRIGST